MRVLKLLFILLISLHSIGQQKISKWNISKIDSLHKIAGTLEFSNHDSSLVLTELLIEKAKDINYEKGFAHAILHKAYLLEDIGKFKEALPLYDSSIVIFNRINELPGIAKARNSVGNLLNYQGKYEKALTNLQIAYDTYSKIGNLNGKAMALGNMGLVQTNNQNYDEALSYYNQSLALKKELGDSLGIAIDMMNIGNAYSFTRKYDIALDYLYSSIEISKLIDDKVGISYCLTSIGEVFLEQNEYKLAEENFLYAVDIQKSISDKNGLASSYRSLGSIYTLQKKSNEAIRVLNAGLDLAIELELAPLQLDIYKILSEAYQDISEFEQALICHQKFSDLKDSIYRNEKNKKIVEIDTKYHTKLKDEELSNQEHKLSQKDKQINSIIKEENFIMIISSIIIIAILSIAILIFYNLIKKRKLALELEKLSIVAREIENTVIIADKHGEIEWINDSYQRKTGFSLDEFKKKFGNYIVNISDSSEIHEIITRCKQEKISVKYVLHTEKKSGEKLWIQTTLTPILNKNGNITKFILVDSDITEIKLVEEQLAIQRDELVSKNNLITESIDYAKRIQSALLPSKQKINNHFSDYFIFYKPKDIVSGDFYWLEHVSYVTASVPIAIGTKQSANEEKITSDSSSHRNDVILFAAADCTGHGVPGALMSIIAMNALNNIVNETYSNPHDILEELSNRIHKKLTHQDHDEQLKDGLDISLCSFSPKAENSQVGILEFSGAHNSLYLIRNNKLTEYQGDKIHIGANRREGNSFTKHTFSIQKGDIIYLFSDGFADQKGGKKGKKFFYEPFRDLLKEIHLQPMNEQNSILAEKISNWKGNLEQLDDMLIWGIRF